MSGVIFLGLFATISVNPTGANGLFHGDSTFFLKELCAVVISSVYAFAFTWVMLWVINKIIRVKTTKEEEELGLDETLLGEHAYSNDLG